MKSVNKHIKSVFRYLVLVSVFYVFILLKHYAVKGEIDPLFWWGKDGFIYAFLILVGAFLFWFFEKE
ncbi:MAG: hypothetical protein GWN55_11755 [Phycisphaerae bacterium]|nr:hypothetical protein [Phycisphaerae bacterium]NIR51498.1 hypothetical protein [candidate division KSB1 bacterium]NIS26900.1 hypothetical protein [candidate division KSB1 bacterium]NIU27631.1 hypothetical protein [candidate division KSB1 bacterium]NIV01974.1 hypothetical protein [Phycisphaerae bacterium]